MTGAWPAVIGGSRTAPHPTRTTHRGQGVCDLLCGGPGDPSPSCWLRRSYPSRSQPWRSSHQRHLAIRFRHQSPCCKCPWPCASTRFCLCRQRGDRVMANVRSWPKLTYEPSGGIRVMTHCRRRRSSLLALRYSYSINSSALSRIDVGTSRPSALAVFILSTVSYSDRTFAYSDRTLRAARRRFP